MSAALSIWTVCRPATPYTDRLIALRDDMDDERADDWLDTPLKQPTACQCFGPGECGGYCPGPANCPMCDDGSDE